MPDKSSLGTRMKYYESLNKKSLIKGLPIIIRLDGRAFHSFCKGLKKPFDNDLINLMVQTTKYLISQTNANIGYTQSDEITLCFVAKERTSEVMFENKTEKMVSIFASMASVFFNKNMEKYLPSKIHLSPVFDCRVFNVPNEHEMVKCLLWRERDATKNSISAIAQSMFSHKELNGVNTSQMQEMMFQKNKTNWNDFPTECKRGSYIQRRNILRKLTLDEINFLPEKHNARVNENFEFIRSAFWRLDMPPISKTLNIMQVIINGENPIEVSDTDENIKIHLEHKEI